RDVACGGGARSHRGGPREPPAPAGAGPRPHGRRSLRPPLRGPGECERGGQVTLPAPLACAQYVKAATCWRSSSDRRARSSTAAPTSSTTSVVVVAADATPVIDTAMSPEPDAASAAARDISAVVAVCSSTAEAIVSR